MFQLEKQMRATTLKNLPGFLPFGTNYAFGLEVPLSYKVADIGFISDFEQARDSRETRYFARLNQIVLWALARLLEQDRTPMLDFLYFLGNSMTESEKTRITESLCKAQIIEESEECEVLPSEWLKCQTGPVVFVELKLSRWEDALHQARYYSRMADLACVVLDGDGAWRVPVERFREEGIGLFAAWPDSIDMLALPRPSKCVSVPYRNFCRLCAVQDLSRKNPRKWAVA